VLAGLAGVDVAAALDKMVYTKSSIWRYEREWRVFAGDGRNKTAPYEDVPFTSTELAGVTFGAKMNDVERSEFEALARKLNPRVEFYEAKVSGGFSLNITPL
jgi:hypothetical protein